MTFEPEERKPHFEVLGNELIKKNQVACILLAGGQGTRLGTSVLSKGFYSISPIRQKSLFELVAEKVKCASKKWQVRLRLAIMTSEINHEAIIDFFTRHQLFGLEKEQLFFFKQTMLPFLDDNENPLPVKGPSGNAAAISDLFHSGIGHEWRKEGVTHLTTILVDNALADPFLVELVGFHQEAQASMSGLAIRHRNELEKVGRYVRREDRVKVIEYMELGEDEKIKNPWANISSFCFSMDFALTHHKSELPIHKVKKPVFVSGNEIQAWKQESFIFDYMDLAPSFHALAYPRELCFAPLKNSSGDDSIETVQAALLRRDRLRWKELFSVDSEETLFELSQCFYYPERELLARYRGKKPVGYVT